MGNQLSATPTVNVSDISSSYTLVGALGGEGKNFFTTLHCLKPLEPHGVATSASPSLPTATSTTTNTTTTSTTSLASTEPLASVLVRANGSTGEQPGLQRWLQQRRRQQQHTRAVMRRGGDAWTVQTQTGQGPSAASPHAPDAPLSSSSGLSGTEDAYPSAAPLTGSPARLDSTSRVMTADVGVPHGLLDGHTNYAQLLLRREPLSGASALATGTRAFLPPGYPGTDTSDPGARLPASSSYPSVSQPSAPQSPASTTAVAQVPMRDVVTKVFVRTATDDVQRELLHRIHHTMLAMSEHMAVVDSTLSPRANRDVDVGEDASDSRTGSHEPRPAWGTAARPACNLLFYNYIQANRDDMFCLLERPYIAYSLPERLMSRPYWLLQERLFACFQLLKALVQLHEEYGVVHGDVKPSNVLVQTSGWLYLCDLAPFKPNRMPAGNPVLFDYSYDTDDTRHCWVAPEKFVDMTLDDIAQGPVDMSGSNGFGSGQDTGDGVSVKGTHAFGAAGTPAGGGSGASRGTRKKASAAMANLNVYGHTPGMDVFSAACVMVYMLTDEPLFRLSDVLELRRRTTRAHREELVCPRLQNCGVPPPLIPTLLSVLCAVDGTERPTARQWLEECLSPSGASLFPTFYELLHGSVLPVVLALSADHQCHLLHAQLSSILSACRGSSEAVVPSPGVSDATGGHTLWRADMTDLYVAQLLSPILLRAICSAATDEATFRGAACLRQLLQRCCACFADATGAACEGADRDSSKNHHQPFTSLTMSYNTVQHLLFGVCIPQLLRVINSPRNYGALARLEAFRTVCDVAVWTTAQMCKAPAIPAATGGDAQSFPPWQGSVPHLGDAATATPTDTPDNISEKGDASQGAEAPLATTCRQPSPAAGGAHPYNAAAVSAHGLFDVAAAAGPVDGVALGPTHPAATTVASDTGSMDGPSRAHGSKLRVAPSPKEEGDEVEEDERDASPASSPEKSLHRLNDYLTDGALAAHEAGAVHASEATEGLHRETPEGSGVHSVHRDTDADDANTSVENGSSFALHRHANSKATQANQETTEPSGVDTVPLMHNTTFFDDLLLPCIAELLRCADTECPNLLAEVAQQLPHLLLAARYCLERRQALHDHGSFRHANRQGTYGGQLNVLQSSGWALCQSLLRPSSPSVAAAALIREVVPLATFLGEERTAQDLIPMLTTATTASLAVRREVFGKSILLHALLQRPPSKTLQFFAAEGLRQEDVVCVKGTLDAMAVAVRARRLPAWETMSMLVHPALPLLVSPVRWVSLAACHLVEAAATSYRTSEVLTYLSCAVQPLLTQRNVPLAALSRYLSSLRGELALTGEVSSGGALGSPTGGRGGERSFLQQQQQEERRQALMGQWAARRAKSLRCDNPNGVMGFSFLHAAGVDADVVHELPIPHTVRPREVNARMQQLLYKALVHSHSTHDTHAMAGRLPEGEGVCAVREAQRQSMIQAEKAHLLALAQSSAASLHLPPSRSPSSSSFPHAGGTISVTELLHRLRMDGHGAPLATATTAASASLFLPGEVASAFVYHNNHGASSHLNNTSSLNRGVATINAPCASAGGSDATCTTIASSGGVRISVESIPKSGGAFSFPAALRGRELRPVAVALDSPSSHLGAVTAALSIRHGCLLTAGARGDILTWQLHDTSGTARYGRRGGAGGEAAGGTSGLSPTPSSAAPGAVVGRLELMDRAPPVAWGSNAGGYTCACHVAVGALGGRHGAAGPTSAATGTSATASAVALGATDGKVRVLSVARNAFISTVSCDGHRDGETGVTLRANGGVTALGLQQDFVVLVTTSDGRLMAVDTRDSAQKPVWSARLPPGQGPPTCLVPLWQADGAQSGETHHSTTSSALCYGVVTGTADGFVSLFDLRFQRCVRGYTLALPSSSGACNEETWAGASQQNRLGATCACPDLFVDMQVRQEGACRGRRRGGGVNLGEDAGITLEDRLGPAILFGTTTGTALRLFLASGHLSAAFEASASTAPSLRPPIRTMLSQPAFGAVFTGSEDGSIRHWHEGSGAPPTVSAACTASHTLCCPPVIPSPAYRRVSQMPVYSATMSASSHTVPSHRHHARLAAGVLPPLPSFLHTVQEGRPAARPAHADAVLALSVVESTLSGEPFLVSGARDGTLCVWENGRPGNAL